MYNLIFPGQGSQIVGMGKFLHDNFQIAKDLFMKTDSLISRNITKIMFDGPATDLVRTANTQIALMSVSAAIIEVIKKETGKKISDFAASVAGHSLGEYSSLFAAEAIDFDTAIKLLDVRGKAMERAGTQIPGAMAAVISAPQDKLLSVINSVHKEDNVCEIASDNSEAQVVISGHQKAIDQAVQKLQAQSIMAIKIPVSGAFHSSLMKSALEDLENALEHATFLEPKVDVITNVSAEVQKDPSILKNHLKHQLAGKVRWRETCNLMMTKSKQFLEIGSGIVLTGMVKRSYKDASVKSSNSLEDVKNIIKLLA